MDKSSKIVLFNYNTNVALRTPKAAKTLSNCQNCHELYVRDGPAKAHLLSLFLGLLIKSHIVVCHTRGQPIGTQQWHIGFFVTGIIWNAKETGGQRVQGRPLDRHPSRSGKINFNSGRFVFAHDTALLVSILN